MREGEGGSEARRALPRSGETVGQAFSFRQKPASKLLLTCFVVAMLSVVESGVSREVGQFVFTCGPVLRMSRQI